MLFLLKLLGTAYVVYLIVALFLAYKTAPPEFKLLFLKMSALIPPMLVLSAFTSIFSFRGARLLYNEKLATTEERIESKRIEIYGGERLNPSVSWWWKALHHAGIQKTLQQAMSASRKIAGFDKAVVNH